MADVLIHLQRNLAQAEGAGQVERAKRIKAKIAELEQGPAEEEPAEEPAPKPAAKPKAPAKKETK